MRLAEALRLLADFLEAHPRYHKRAEAWLTDHGERRPLIASLLRHMVADGVEARIACTAAGMLGDAARWKWVRGD